MQAKFTQGSIFKHICVMTFTSTVGLLFLFFVDLVDMYWLSLLGELELAAAIGYAGSILFFSMSLCIGLSIGCAALISQHVGKGDKDKTKQLVGNIFAAIVVITIIVLIAVLALLDHLLTWLGAKDHAFEFAKQYLTIILPSMPLMGLAMASNGLMRALGKPKQAMYITLIGGLVNAVLDPVFIFGFGLGIQGAAIATVLSRVAMLAFAYLKIVREYKLISLPQKSSFVHDIKRFFQTAIPAVLTNLSTPIGVAYVTAVMAQFGDAAVAGNAIISKVQPLAFAGLFALSGSIGPIAGQNLGANQFDRIMSTLRSSIYFTLAYCVVACLALLLLTDILIAVFQAKTDAALLIRWFCYGLSTVFVFNGITFVTNAMFNNLNSAHWATVFNFAKATIFTMPFAIVGAKMGGPIGIYIGIYIGAVIVALLGAGMAFKIIKDLYPKGKA